MQFLIVSGPFFLILPVIKNRVNYNFFAFTCVKYGKWESSNNASSEIGIAFCLQIWEAELLFSDFSIQSKNSMKNKEEASASPFKC